MAVVSGTFLGYIIIDLFEVDVTCSSLTKLSSIQNRAHDGSVFSLDVLASKCHSSTTMLVATCSDDRKLKIWSFQALTTNYTVDDGSNDRGPIPQTKLIDLQLIVDFIAHSSRVWKVRIMASGLHDTISLVSFGEDSTIKMWLVRIRPNGQKCLEVAAFRELYNSITHSGKNIWAGFDSHFERYVEIFSGGADSAIVLSRLKLEDDDHTMNSAAMYNQIHGQISTEFIFSETPRITNNPDNRTTSTIALEDRNGLILAEHTMAAPKEDAVKNIALITPTSFVAVSRGGKVTYGKIHLTGQDPDTAANSGTFEWKFWGQFPNLRTYSVSVGLPCSSIALLTGSSGPIIYCRSDGPRLTKGFSLDEKPAKLHAQRLESMSGVDHTFTAVLISYVSVRSSKFLILKDLGDGPIVIRMLVLSLSRGFQVTSMQCFATTYDDQYLLLVGGRDGRMAIYNLNVLLMDELNASRECVVEPLEVVKFNQDAVTSIKFLSQRSKSYERGLGEGEIRVICTSRDSSCITLEIRYTSDICLCYIVDSTQLKSSMTIEGHALRSPKDSLMIYGFRGVNFVVYDCNQCLEILTVGCGGSHRLWDFGIFVADAAQSSAPFAVLLYVRSGKIHWVIQRKPDVKSVKLGAHGREIKSCKILRPKRLEEIEGRSIAKFATGAEDTDIRIHTLNLKTSDTSYARIVRGHNTGVQQLQWDESGRYLFSCGGSGELFAWKVRELNHGRIGVVPRASMSLSTDSDLRVTGFDILEYGANGEEAEFLICIVQSNSAIKVSPEYHARVVKLTRLQAALLDGSN